MLSGVKNMPLKEQNILVGLGLLCYFNFYLFIIFNYFSNFNYYVHQSTKILPINLMKSIVKVCMVKVKIYYSTRVQEIVLYNLVMNGLVAG